MMSDAGKISRSSTRRRTPRKPKKSQIPFALLVTMLVITFGFYLNSKSTNLAVFWIFGISFGYILQRSRFCFTAAFRDPCITGSTSVTRAVLVAFAVATVGVTAFKFGAVLSGGETNLNMIGVAPIGLPLILGAIIFGIGMVIAGGCASGTFMRIGEGFTMQILSLVFFIIGSMLGVEHGTFWNQFNSEASHIFLPDILGWFGALVVQFSIIILLYIAAIKWQQKKLGSVE